MDTMRKWVLAIFCIIILNVLGYVLYWWGIFPYFLIAFYIEIGLIIVTTLSILGTMKYYKNMTPKEDKNKLSKRINNADEALEIAKKELYEKCKIEVDPLYKFFIQFKVGEDQNQITVSVGHFVHKEYKDIEALVFVGWNDKTNIPIVTNRNTLDDIARMSEPEKLKYLEQIASNLCPVKKIKQKPTLMLQDGKMIDLNNFKITPQIRDTTPSIMRG